MLAFWKKDIRAVKEKVGDSARMSARRGGCGREVKWGKALVRVTAYCVHVRRICCTVRGTLQEGQKVRSEFVMR